MEKGDVKTEEHSFVKWFSELSSKDVSIAGGKGASLAEMYNNKFPIPPGFSVTAEAYSYFIDKAGIRDKISRILKNLNVEDTAKLEEKTKEIRELISNSEMPAELMEQIIESYDILDVDRKNFDNASRQAMDILKNSHEPIFVAVRSSATMEDLADASFAGQQESFLNVKGKENLILKVKECFASLFTSRAVYYRTKKGFAHDRAQLSVVIQKMIDSEKSGVMFSKDPVSSKDQIVIEAVWGLGEGIVSGRIKPDHYVVSGDVSDLKILNVKISEKKVAIVRNSAGENQIVSLSDERAKRQVLSNYELKILAGYAKKLEEHYKKPQDIEFAISKNEIYIVQSRPITTIFSGENHKEITGNILLKGLGASPGISFGKVKIVKDLKELSKVENGDVLVTEMTNPDMVVSMQKAAAIVTDEGGITSHASIVSREMGIPAVVGTGNATSLLKDGQIVTVDGFSGNVYEGKGEIKEVEINKIVPTKTKIKVIVDLPDFAERAAKSGAKEVGLVRLEGIIAESGKHPIYFFENGNIEEYSELIFRGLKKIAEHFDGMWVRTSDLRSDEFLHLQGAPQIKEENPMLGDHGIRFSLKHKDIFKAEIIAMKKLAEEFSDKKFGLMIPQVINVSEIKETKALASELKMPENVAIGIMVETPAAVQIIGDLCEEGISFVSFGTNDLTQYMLAIDRNNSNVQDLYSEMHPAVLSALSYVIRKCRKYKIETSICGQAGSREEMARFLVKEGIDSISVNADAAEKVSKIVAEIEGINYSPSIKQEKVEMKNVEEVYSDPVSENDVKKEDKDVLAENGVKDKVELPDLAQQGMRKDSLNQDIEDVLLRELESSDYEPGNADNKKDIPQLNDAIPIDSDLFNRLEKRGGVGD